MFSTVQLEASNKLLETLKYDKQRLEKQLELHGQSTSQHIQNFQVFNKQLLYNCVCVCVCVCVFHLYLDM